jgi:hypothetical protein
LTFHPFLPDATIDNQASVAVVDHPETATALAHLREANGRLGRLDLQTAQLEQAASIGGVTDIQLDLANAYSMQGLYEKAIEAPTDCGTPKAMLLRAVQFGHLGEYSE